jgi:hypothetical protein
VLIALAFKAFVKESPCTGVRVILRLASSPVGGMVDTAVFKTDAWRQTRGSSPLRGTTVPKALDMTSAEKMTEQHIQKLREQVQRIESEIRSLQDKRSGLVLAITVLTGQPVPADTTARRARLPLKDIVLRMTEAHSERGIVAADIVEIGKAEGLELDRNSVSSLLSRFKKEGVLTREGGRYRPARPFPREVRGAA